MYDHMYSSISLQFVFFLLIAIVLGGISGLLAKIVQKESRRTVQIYIIIVLVFISLITFTYHIENMGYAGLLIQFIAMLWYPAAIVMACVILSGIPGTLSGPYGVFTVSAVVYLTESYFDAYVAGIIGLRFVNFLIIIPPPALPYEWLEIPEVYKVIIQFTTTFVLASLIFWLGKRLASRSNDNSG